MSNREQCFMVEGTLCEILVGVGVPSSQGPAAQHLQNCASCRKSANQLGDLRSWLAWGTPTGETVPSRQRVRSALTWAVSARLARDMSSLAGSGPRRPVGETKRDIKRLRVLLGEEACRRGPWREALFLMEDETRKSFSRIRLMDVAVRLDPTGLDLALSHLCALERGGQPFRAKQMYRLWRAVFR